MTTTIYGKTPYEISAELYGASQGAAEEHSWSRLSKKHPDWDFIDWPALYKTEAKLLHRPTEIRINAVVRSKYANTSKNPVELWLLASPEIPHLNKLHGATQAALDDRDGWELYIKGEIPTHPLFADELDPGTCFLGLHPTPNGGEKHNAVVVEQPNNMPKLAVFADPIQNQPAAEIQVVKIYGLGTFKKLEEDA